MAKKTEKKRSFNLFAIFLMLFVCALVFIWNSDFSANWKDHILHYIDNEEIATFETAFTPEQILQTHKNELLGNQKKSLRQSSVKYYPYLLIDVKYKDLDGKTKEGTALWGMTDGELVLQTEKWERTHGFQDCLECGARKNDFKILKALARNQGKMTLDELQRQLQLEREMLYSWIESARNRQLVTQAGNVLSLHFENPKFAILPQSTITQPIVIKPQFEGKKVARNYSKRQLFEVAQDFFGSDLKIKKDQEVFLPVYVFETLNPDGSIQISEWNSLTGERLPATF